MIQPDVFRRRREEMVATQLIPRGIHDSGVLDAMGSIPREEFIDPNLANEAYSDRALATELGQTISQPYIVAFMTECLAIEPRHRVLEIGTGTGYQTAVLARMGAIVYTIERWPTLAEGARDRLIRLGVVNVHYRCADGTLGWPEAAPFDRILVTAAAPCVVRPLTEQLAEGGQLILPVGDATSQHLVIVENSGGKVAERKSIGVRFVRLIGEAGFKS